LVRAHLLVANSVTMPIPSSRSNSANPPEGPPSIPAATASRVLTLVLGPLAIGSGRRGRRCASCEEQDENREKCKESQHDVLLTLRQRESPVLGPFARWARRTVRAYIRRAGGVGSGLLAGASSASASHGPEPNVPATRRTSRGASRHCRS